LQVKRWICWNGQATKHQVQKALTFLFKLKEAPKPDDAADALAIAYIWSLQKIWLLW
jgi:crossover junction endodeoxyribonuclease RuvC